MTKSVAELRAAKPTGRPQRTMTLCLAPHLVAEVQALTVEHDRALPTEDEDAPPQRLGGAPNKRVREIRDRLADLLEEMGEYEGELTLRANLSDGEWRRWTNEHPAREEGAPGYDRDQRVTSGFCNADALIDAIDKFVHQWNGEHITASDWAEVFEPVVGSADLAAAAAKVVEMYESRLDFRRLRSGLSANLKRLNVSDSPAPSGSPTSDSTAGSPESSTSTSTTSTDESQASS